MALRTKTMASRRTLSVMPRRDQAPTPQAIALRSNVVNAFDSHEPWKVSGVVSVGSAGGPARIAGLWQWPSMK